MRTTSLRRRDHASNRRRRDAGGVLLCALLPRPGLLPLPALPPLLPLPLVRVLLWAAADAALLLWVVPWWSRSLSNRSRRDLAQASARAPISCTAKTCRAEGKSSANSSACTLARCAPSMPRRIWGLAAS